MGDYSRIESKLDDCCFISVGYRCHTALLLKKYNLISFSLPFDNGFFPPQSIASVLKSGNMNLSLNCRNEPKNFNFVSKQFYKDNRYESNNDFKNKHLRDFIDGQVFNNISEEKINEDYMIPEASQILDLTGGYFTLHRAHNFVLAHYLWHKSSKNYKTNYRNTIDILSGMFQRRLNRLNELCANHKNKFFIHYHQSSYNLFKINDNEYDLTDMDILKNQLTESFGENTLLCFSNFKKKNENGIFYFDNSEYEKFCKYTSSKINNK